MTTAGGRWRSDPEDPQLARIATELRGFEGFDRTRPVVVARAPARLDVMGGIADYSGSLVLELPLEAATWVAAQATDGREAVVESSQAEAMGAAAPVRVAIGDLVPGEGPLAYAQARTLLNRDPARAWSAYVLGALVVLHRELGHPLRTGIRLVVRSEVPPGKGVASSAALEVAALQAVAAVAGIALAGRDLALLAQKVENFVVGAPCGVMDQMTSACGRAGQLLELLCQPAELRGHVPLPADLEVFGIDSGIRHAVSGADYTTVRAAAFMGYRIVAAALGLSARTEAPGRVAIDDPVFRGYIANVTPSLWRSRFRDLVPEAMTGRAFLDAYAGFTDSVTAVDPARTYAVRACAAHPIHEHHRVQLFRTLLAASGPEGEPARGLLGELMYQSHASYSVCGLGSEGTDRLVDLVREAGPGSGLHGAKITGGGSGGTVAVLARAGRRAAVEEVVERYRRETGRDAAIFGGSSAGAVEYGVRRLVFAAS